MACTAAPFHPRRKNRKRMKNLENRFTTASKLSCLLKSSKGGIAALAAVCGLLIAPSKLSAGVPYISSVTVEGTQGTYDGYNCYGLSALLKLPEPNVNYMQWIAIANGTSIVNTSTTWPNPNSLWVYSDSWNSTDHTVKVKAVNSADNGYYLSYNGSSYSYFCHGCSQGGGGVYIYNP